VGENIMTKTENVYEAKGGYATKNDIINSIGCALEELAKNHRGEPVIPCYRFHIKIREMK
jgi:hypothetical protein